MSELPQRVQVGPFWFEIRRSDTPTEDNNFGHTAYQPETAIYIGTEVRPARAAVTLLHEIIHAMNYSYGLKDVEDTVKVQAYGLAQALQSIGWMPREIET